MRLERLRIAAGLIAAVTAMAAPSFAQQRDGFGEAVDVNVVNVDVYVTDKSGRPVTGLRKEDFELREDGKRVEVTNFEAFAGASSPPLRAEQPAAAPATLSGGPAPAAPPTADPLHLVVYVDNFNIEPAHRARALQQIRTYLDKEVAPGDRVMVATSDRGGVHVRQPFTDDRAALAGSLDEVTRMVAHGGEIARAKQFALDAMYSMQDEAIAMYSVGGKMERATDDAEGDPSQGSLDVPCSLRIADPIKGYAEAAHAEVLQTVASLKLFVNSLSGLPGRKVLLHVSDGITITPGEELFQILAELCGGGGTTSGLTGSMGDPASQPQDARRFGARAYQTSQAMLDAQHYSTASEWSELAAHANANRVTLYTLQASGLEGHGAASAEHQGGGRDQVLRLGTVMHIETNNRKDSLNVLASDTGGRAVFNANDLLPELDRIQEDLETYYSLGFAPRRLGDGREHRIEVKVKREDLRVRHRRSYRDKSPLERAADRTLAALFYGTEENPLEVSADIGEIRPAEGKTFSVPVQIEIPLHKLFLRDDLTNLVGKVRLLVATQSAEGDTSRVRQVEIPIRIPRGKALVALGKSFGYNLTLTMKAGDQRVAVAIQDTATSQTSYLSRNVKVGGETAAR